MNYSEDYHRWWNENGQFYPPASEGVAMAEIKQWGAPVFTEHQRELKDAESTMDTMSDNHEAEMTAAEQRIAELEGKPPRFPKPLWICYYGHEVHIDGIGQCPMCMPVLSDPDRPKKKKK